MVPDPVMQEVYATKEMLAARHAYDLGALVASIDSGPSWNPLKKPARIIQTANARFERVVDDPIIRELRAIREKMLADNNGDLHALTKTFRTNDPGQVRAPSASRQPEGPAAPARTKSDSGHAA